VSKLYSLEEIKLGACSVVEKHIVSTVLIHLLAHITAHEQCDDEFYKGALHSVKGSVLGTFYLCSLMPDFFSRFCILHTLE
jgi:hypothetical protein